MNVKIFMGGDDSATSYIIYNEQREAVLIDPSFKATKIVKWLKEESINLLAILLTHGHFDHIEGIEEVKKSFSCPIYIEKSDEVLLDNPYKNGSVLFGKYVQVLEKTENLWDEETLHFSDIEVQVIHTPFHTPGSVCFYFPKIQSLFTGDTLFYRSIGRTDLPLGNAKDVTSSLLKVKKFYKNNGDMKVYPGHGNSTSLEKEIEFNPFMND